VEGSGTAVRVEKVAPERFPVPPNPPSPIFQLMIEAGLNEPEVVKVEMFVTDVVKETQVKEA